MCLFTSSSQLYYFRSEQHLHLRPQLQPPPVDPTIQKLKQDILSLHNEINKMRTEAEWKSEARSGGL